MHLTMIGTGYVGLVSGACFSEFGHDVICVDNRPHVIEALEAGKIPIYEPGLDELVARNVKAGRLKFTTHLAKAIDGCDAAFIAVGTPSRRGDGHADLSFVYEAARQVAEAVTGKCVIVNKSTVPVGTGAEVDVIVKKTAPNKEIYVASNPEFLREGSAIEDFMRPDRVVVGVASDDAKQVMTDIYRPLFLRDTPILFTSRETAEIIKYAANAFLATKIGFINDIANLCEKVGGDVQQVAKGIGLDNRIGSKFLNAGPGYGGSCFPKDTLALLRTAQDLGMPLGIVAATVAANDQRKLDMAERVISACGGDVKGKTIAVLGLTFKPNTDDMRDAPSLVIVPTLQKAGATIRAFDPAGMDQAKPMLSDVAYCTGPYDAMHGADALLIITEWNEFRALDMTQVKSLLKSPVFVDLRNIYKPDEMQAKGFKYYSIGRGNAKYLDV